MTDFNNWLDDILANVLPESIEAICFNLYEDGADQWSIEFVGAGSFDEDDPDWACDEVFALRDTPLVLERTVKWNEFLSEAQQLITDYLKNGRYADKLTQYKAVATGFVDGDLTVLYKKTEPHSGR
ncbi:MAG: hypothetical protein E7478_03750 [Ruminococcaceae bacterium]|nr:hypothetical protein [Oscillospiraceae bacterium]